MGYSISEWGERYEVNENNNAAKPGEKLRKGPLTYLRLPCNGRNWSLAYRRFLSVAKDNAPDAYGLWTKLLEIAGDAPAGQRGVIRDDAGIPLDSRGISDALGWPLKKVEQSLSILTNENVGWVTVFDVTPGSPGKSRSESDHSQVKTETHPPVGGGYSDAFEQFWKAYPQNRREAKKAAHKSWTTQKPVLSEVLAALEWQRKSEKWTKDGGQYIPMPATYINQRRWEDEPQVAPTQKTELERIREMHATGRL
jgi:hypothetical protein